MNRDDEDSAKKNKPTLDAPPPPPPGVVDVNEKGQPIRGADGTSLDTAELKYPTDEIAKYDDAEWHYDGDFPRWTPRSYAFSHIGFYYAWALEQGQASDYMREEFPDAMEATLKRRTSPIALIKLNDDKLLSDMLNDEGNAFASVYYAEGPSGYLTDYSNEFSDHRLYKVKPNWKNYDRIKPVISRRYEEWRNVRNRPPG